MHSRYQRGLLDAPWGSVPVQFNLRIRRFFCDAEPCGRATFAEQVEELTCPHAQRTQALNGSLRALGLALGGAAGSCLGRILGILGSGDRILRRVRSAMPTPSASRQVIGSDEWATRKGKYYVSLIVDLEWRAPIDMLPEHSPGQVATWWQAHPGIEVTARARTTLYAEALGQGAPEAQQVADR